MRSALRRRESRLDFAPHSGNMRAVKAKSTSGREPARAIDADVLVVGGGIVGCTVACALGQAGFSVVLADRERWERFTDPRFDGRAFAIALASRRMFEGLGVWRHAGREAAAILEIRVSERGSRKYLHYDHREVGPEPFGHMVEARTLRRALAFRLAKLGGVHLLAPMTVEGLRTTDTGVEALLADGRRVRAALSVASDGRASRTRAGAGIRVTGWDYPQTAIICTIAHEHPHGNVAHEHFLPAGPFAILPLNGRRSAIVWTERRELAPAIMALDADAFRDELADRVGTFLGRIEPVGPRWAHALSLQYAETAIAPRIALVGDALHAMHPIAGQGLNMGLRDAAALADVLVDARGLGLDIGFSTVLERYARWRRFDNTVMLAATNGLNRLFSNDIRPLKRVRDAGLAAVGRVPVLKRAFMRNAMGIVGDLPRLMR